MKNFIIQYNSYHTVKGMFQEFEKAISGKKLVQPKNLMIVSDLGIVDKLITKSRMELLACLQEVRPNNVWELASLLSRDHDSIQEDLQILSGLDIIKLQKEGSEVKPVALYDPHYF
jgi:predicted transcriptional regulator